ncbi:MAG: redoxin domain-containing protein [Chloroflexi bacterium]|nr:redoxin domain-containing protein [Chloroflexota bacterium]
MNKSQAYKSPSKTESVTTHLVGPNRIKVTIGIVAVLILAVVGWVGWNVWQTRQRAFAPAAPDSPAVVTSASIVGQSQSENSAVVVKPVGPDIPQGGSANLNVPPIALADISGNVADGRHAPDFAVRTMGGGKFALADHASQPTLLMFSASWCASCLFEAQNLGQVYARYKERGLNVIMLDVQAGDTDAELQTFREAAGNPDYVWAFDDNYTMSQAFEVTSLDTTVLIDQAGKIVYRDEYPTPLEPLLQAVAGVLP